jgi:hypothetical protein
LGLTEKFSVFDSLGAAIRYLFAHP